MAEEIYKAYEENIERVTKLSNLALKNSNNKLNMIGVLLKKEILEYKEGIYLPSNVSQAILESKTITTQYEANILIARATNRYTRVKEVLQIQVERTLVQEHSNIRQLREVTQASFMSDPLVLSTIKTIKHQEILFSNLYETLLDNYRQLKDNRDSRLEVLKDFLRQGFLGLSGISKFLYNLEASQGIELNLGSEVHIGDITPKPKTRKKLKKFKKKDLE